MTSSASAFAKLVTPSLSSRTVFVKCTPVPANFTERRAVLRSLYSSATEPDIEVFKKLEDNSSFIAVTTTPEAAGRLVESSPLRRAIITPGSRATATFATTAWGGVLRAGITDPVNPQPVEEDAATGPVTSAFSFSSWGKQTDSDVSPPDEHLGPMRKVFTIRVFPANADYNHNQIIRRNVLHGPWPVRDGADDTFMAAALRKVVPSGAMAPGLRDWETGRQLAADRGDGHGYYTEGARSLLDKGERKGPAWDRSAMEERLRRKGRKNQLPEVMKGLLAVYEGTTDEANTKSGGYKEMDTGHRADFKTLDATCLGEGYAEATGLAGDELEKTGTDSVTTRHETNSNPSTEQGDATISTALSSQSGQFWQTVAPIKPKSGKKREISPGEFIAMVTGEAKAQSTARKGGRDGDR